jgi:C7-cyclitol 7-kinase
VTPSDRVLVLEAGGTTARAAAYDVGTGRLSSVRREPTPGPRTGESAERHHRRVLGALAELAEQVRPWTSPPAVGVAYAGPLDDRGRVLAAPTVLRDAPGQPFDLRAQCRRLWPGAEVVCMNDLTAAGHAYAATGLRDFAVLTVGSGVGHKVFLDGRPRVGRGRGGEIGHLRLDFSADAPPCDCGGSGHLGALASGRGTTALVARRARAEPARYAASALAGIDPGSLRGEDVAAAFRAGDAFARDGVAEGAHYLGVALAALHLDTGVEDVVVIGGFAHGLGEDYRRLLVAAAAASSWSVGQDWDRMVRLGDGTIDPDEAALLGLGHACAGLLASPAAQLAADSVRTAAARPSASAVPGTQPSSS